MLLLLQVDVILVGRRTAAATAMVLVHHITKFVER